MTDDDTECLEGAKMHQAIRSLSQYLTSVMISASQRSGHSWTQAHKLLMTDRVQIVHGPQSRREREREGAGEGEGAREGKGVGERDREREQRDEESRGMRGKVRRIYGFRTDMYLRPPISFSGEVKRGRWKSRCPCRSCPAGAVRARSP